MLRSLTARLVAEVGFAVDQMTVWATKLDYVLGGDGSAVNDCTGGEYGLWVCCKCCCIGILNESESGASSERKTLRNRNDCCFSARLRREGASSEPRRHPSQTKGISQKRGRERASKRKSMRGRSAKAGPSRREGSHRLRYMAATTDQSCGQISIPTPMFHWRPADMRDMNRVRWGFHIVAMPDKVRKKIASGCEAVRAGRAAWHILG